jgi:hypothetical protein
LDINRSGFLYPISLSLTEDNQRPLGLRSDSVSVSSSVFLFHPSLDFVVLVTLRLTPVGGSPTARRDHHLENLTKEGVDSLLLRFRRR